MQVSYNDDAIGSSHAQGANEMSFVNAADDVQCAGRSWLRWMKMAVAAVILVGLAASRVCAQDAEGAAAGGGGKSWAIPWLIVFLSLALGIFITLRPAGRETEVKRDPRIEL